MNGSLIIKGGELIELGLKRQRSGTRKSSREQRRLQERLMRAGEAQFRWRE